MSDEFCVWRDICLRAAWGGPPHCVWCCTRQKSCRPPFSQTTKPARAIVADARPRSLQPLFSTSSPCASSYLDVDMAALVVAAMAMVFVSVSCPNLRLPLSPRCTLSRAKQGAPCQMCVREGVCE